MTTKTKAAPAVEAKKAEKSYPTEAEIERVMKEQEVNRIGAIHMLRRGLGQPSSKPEVYRQATKRAHAGKAPKAKKAKVAKDVEPLTPQKQTALDRIIRDAAGKDAIDRLLKSSLSPKYTRYQFWGTAKGNVVNCNIDAGTAKLMDEKSTTVKNWRKLQARELKAGEAKLAGAKKEAAK